MSLKFLFNPEAVALVGASNKPSKVGWQVLDNLLVGGWRGRIYPINLQEKKIAGRPAFKSLADLVPVKFSSLLVIIAIPVSFVVAEVDKAARLGVKNIIIISSGFKESGPAGRRQEELIQALARKYKLNILGPNCLGLINTSARLNATFATADRQGGRIALISQSGAIGAALLDWLKQKKLNLGYFVSLGNKAVLDETDILDYLQHDKQIDLFVFYLEEIKNGQRLMRLISRLAQQRPVAILKSGQSATAQKLALSHTGALAGSTAIIKAGLERAGAVWLENLEELFNFLLLFKKNTLLRPGRVVLNLITNAGGPAVLTVDEISRQGLAVGATLDLLGDADAARYQVALQKLLARPSVHNLLILLTPQTMTEPLKVAQVITQAAKRYPRKLIVCSFIGGEAIQSAKEWLLQHQVPFFDYPEEAVKTLAKLAGHWRAVKHLKKYSAVPRALESSQDFTPARRALKLFGAQAQDIRDYQAQVGARRVFLGDYLKSLAWLKRAGLKIARTEKYSRAAKLRGRYPLVLKVVGPDFLHKTDQGAVVTNLYDSAACQRAARQFQKSQQRALKNPRNYLIVQEQITEALEVIIGVKQDPSFGPIVLLGLGGIYAEVFKETLLATADLDLASARDLIKSWRFYPILNGARGRRYDVEGLAAALLSLARLARQYPTVKEVDINPLFVQEKRVLVGDVRVLV